MSRYLLPICLVSRLFYKPNGKYLKSCLFPVSYKISITSRGYINFYVRSTFHYRTISAFVVLRRCYGLFSYLGKCLPHLFIVREYSGFNTSLPSAPGTLLHPVIVFSLSCLCFKTPTQIASDILHIDSMDDALRTGISFYI